MNSILNICPATAKAVTEVAEVAGFLWQKGWAERNGGNISVNISDEVADAVRRLPAIATPIAIGRTLPNIKNGIFFCKGTNKRMRDLARNPMANGSVIRVSDDGANYSIIADNPVKPTSEIVSHLSIHNYLVGKGSDYRAVVHTHPIDLVAMSHNPAFLKKDVLGNLLWSMIPETRAFCPRGLGIAHYALPGSFELADATIAQLDQYDVVMWEKHGVCSVSQNVGEAFDMIDTLSKSAQIYLVAKSMGFEPEGISQEKMDEMKRVFNL